MMIFKVGNDIIEVDRIKRIFEKFDNKFKNRVYTNKEIEYCESKGKNKYQSYAARFAAKEAIFKAISDNLNNKYEIEWKDIEIINDKNGRPIATVKKFDFINNIDISMSHVKEYAIATVIVMLERKD